mmetsp:Transcript_16061/g.23324  ORF Transcript_16061/g.23324 Transcript_16061/m.23324 type:complete len:249 (-) Transcript_16061:1218-1964(-)
MTQVPRFEALATNFSADSNPSSLPMATAASSLLFSLAIASTLLLTSCPGALHNMRGIVELISLSVIVFNSFSALPSHGKSVPKISLIFVTRSADDLRSIPLRRSSFPVKSFPNKSENTNLSSTWRLLPTRAAVSKNKNFLTDSIRVPSAASSIFLPSTFSKIDMNVDALNSYKKLISLIASSRMNRSRHMFANGSNCPTAPCTCFITSELFEICSSTCSPSRIRTSIPSTTRSSSRILPSTALILVSI